MKQGRPGKAVNYWDELGNLAQVVREGDPRKGDGQYWANLLDRIKAGCDKHNPDWRPQKKAAK